MLEFRARSVAHDLKFVRTYLCPDIETAISKTFDNQISAQVRPGRSYTWNLKRDIFILNTQDFWILKKVRCGLNTKLFDGMLSGTQYFQKLIRGRTTPLKGWCSKLVWNRDEYSPGPGSSSLSLTQD